MAVGNEWFSVFCLSLIALGKISRLYSCILCLTVDSHQRVFLQLCCEHNSGNASCFLGMMYGLFFSLPDDVSDLPERILDIKIMECSSCYQNCASPSQICTILPLTLEFILSKPSLISPGVVPTA